MATDEVRRARCDEDCDDDDDDGDDVGVERKGMNPNEGINFDLKLNRLRDAVSIERAMGVDEKTDETNVECDCSHVGRRRRRGSGNCGDAETIEGDGG